MRSIRTILPIIIAGLAIPFFSACSGSSDPAADLSEAPIPQGVIAITGDDQMKFSLSEIRVKAGETVTLRLANIGKMPKQAMSHNWVLLKPMSGGEINAFGMKAASKPPHYLPEDRSAVIAHTAMLGAGESDTIEFTAPPAGVYPFLCSFPGHYAIMRGQLISE